MSCVGKHIIQQYIDGECTDQEAQQIAVHLQECPVCRYEYEGTRELAGKVQVFMDSLVDEDISVPQFILPHKPGTIKRKKVVRLAWVLVAACFVGLLFILRTGKDNGKLAAVNMLGNDIVIDANLPYADQKLKIMVVDPEGRISEYIPE
jgi:anti-sigma factor RsiW